MIIKLAPVSAENSLCLQQALASRRSCREFSDAGLTQQQLTQLLWAAQGETGVNGKRCAPSAGAQYPLEVYFVCAGITALADGCYRYLGDKHAIELCAPGDLRPQLLEAALDAQPWVGEASIIVILTADFDLMRNHFMTQPPRGERGNRYVYLEAGAVAQNLQLQATSLELGAVLVGGFNDDMLHQAIQLKENRAPLALICIGLVK